MSVSRLGWLNVRHNRDTIMSLLDDIELIEEVKKYPMLFDTNAKGYKDHETKDRTWLKISSKLQVKPLEAKNRWRNLRDRFVREKKLMSESSSEKSQKTVPWPLLEHMSFIWNFIIHRRRYSMNALKSEPKPYPIAPKRDATEWMISLNCEDNEGVLRGSKNDQDQAKQKRQKLLSCQEQSAEGGTELYHVSDDTRSYTQKMDQCVNSQSYVADEQHYFCMSVAETLRRFTQRQSAEAKLKIQQILYETEFGNNNTAFEDAFIDPQ